MSWHLGGPVDPGWAPFKDGLEKHFTDLSRPCPRWDPQQRTWYLYPGTTWTLAEVSLPDVDPGSAIDPEVAYVDGVLKRFLKIGVYGVDDLFVKLRDTEAASRSRYPRLVWNPVSGAWRQAEKLPAPPPAPPGTPAAPCEKQINEIKRLRDSNVITPSQAEEAIRDILRSCT